MRIRAGINDKEIIIIDFKTDIVRSLDAHYDHSMRDSYHFPCPVCESRIKQDWDECYCGAQVVWESSELWKSKFGSPKHRLRLLQQYAPETLHGKRLIRMAGRWTQGFKFKTHRQEWQRLCHKATKDQMEYVFNRIGKDKPTYGRVNHAINLLRVVVNDDSKDEILVSREKTPEEEKEVRF